MNEIDIIPFFYNLSLGSFLNTIIINAFFQILAHSFIWNETLQAFPDILAKLSGICNGSHFCVYTYSYLCLYDFNLLIKAKGLRPFRTLGLRPFI